MDGSNKLTVMATTIIKKGKPIKFNYVQERDLQKYTNIIVIHILKIEKLGRFKCSNAMKFIRFFSCPNCFDLL